jgi:hypothetical protein
MIQASNKIRNNAMGLRSKTWQQIPAIVKKLFAAMLLAHVLLLTIYTLKQSPACDETSYFDYAVRWAKGRPERLINNDDSKTPMVFPALTVLALKPLFSNKSYAFWVEAGRVPMYLYTAIAALGILFWMQTLGKIRWWWVAVLLFLADPVVLSNSMLIGSDMATASFWLWVPWLGLRLGLLRQPKHLYALSFACALGLLAKTSMVYLLPLAAAGYLTGSFQVKGRKSLMRLQPIHIAASLILYLLVLHAVYGFYNLGQLPPATAWQSLKLQQIATHWPLLWQGIRLLPLPVVQSVDWLMHNAEAGGGFTDAHSYKGVFLLGNYKPQGGFWQYYLVAFWYKWPDAYALLGLVLAGFGIANIWQKKQSRPNANLFLLAGSALAYWAIVSFTNPFQIGIRHALPILAPVYVLMAAALGTARPWKTYCIGLLFVLQIGHLSYFWPNLNGFASLRAGNPAMLFKKLFDSTFYYCADQKLYQQFLAEHPQYKAPPSQPAPGRYAIRLSSYADHYALPCRQQHWLLKNHNPVGHYKTGILLYDIKAIQ